MNFSEKLTNLRKQKGLSQEELGEKLNVTRQTISKWELGQTSPDMAKLTEIATFFEVSVDELTNEEKTIKEEKSSAKGSNSGAKTALIIIIVLVVIALGIGIYFMSKFISFGSSIFNRSRKMQNLILDGSEKIVNTIQEVERKEKAEEENKKVSEPIESAQDAYEEIKNSIKTTTEELQIETQELQTEAQKILNEAQEKQQDIMKEASQEQQELLNEAQKMQQELLQKMQ